MKVQKLYHRSDTTHQESINKEVVPVDQSFTFGEMEFNVGVILWPNDYSHHINMSLVDDYVQFEAMLNHYTWDNGRKINRTKVQMVPCSADVFYEPYGPQRDGLLNILPYASCLPNHEEITLQGNSYTDNI